MHLCDTTGSLQTFQLKDGSQLLFSRAEELRSHPRLWSVPTWLYCWMLYRNMKYDWNMFVGCDMIIYDLSRVIILLAGIGTGPGSILCDQFSATIEGWRAWTDPWFQWRIHMEWTANDKWQLSHKMIASHKLYPVLLILILVWFFHIPCLHHIIVVYFILFLYIMFLIPSEDRQMTAVISYVLWWIRCVHVCLCSLFAHGVLRASRCEP